MTTTEPPQSSKTMIWIGRVLSGLIVLALLLDAVMKVVKAEVSVQGTVDLGYPESVVVPIGLALLVSTILYAIPRTAVLGAILLTGYLGGAVASHVRLEDPSFVFAVVCGVLAWLGLYLRDARVRVLIPLNSKVNRG